MTIESNRWGVCTWSDDNTFVLSEVTYPNDENAFWLLQIDPSLIRVCYKVMGGMKQSTCTAMTPEQHATFREVIARRFR